MSLEFDDGLAYRDGAQLATVVWVQYTGDDPDLSDSYLLMNRNKELGQGQWAGLGGKIEDQDFDSSDEKLYTNDDIKEAAEENAIREAYEEAKIGVQNTEHIGKVKRYTRPGSDQEKSWEIHHFIAETNDLPDSYEHREGELDWYKPDEMDELNFGMAHDEFIDNVRDRTPFTAWIDDLEGPYGVASDEEGYMIQKSDERVL
ncbi:MAG: NUDIX domain-containing protein [Candidatus Nanohaloarchaea archaeon]|nr:NUDIX domain-containing protein [Candidatus Nanohaloarchaea archaeon]